MEEMQESRQVCRAKLAETIKRKRHSLYALKITEGKVPSSMKERHATSIQRITEELQKLEQDFHELNVQQIREKL
jgi:predicted nuclease with TOPRIM domain